MLAKRAGADKIIAAKIAEGIIPDKPRKIRNEMERQRGMVRGAGELIQEMLPPFGARLEREGCLSVAAGRVLCGYQNKPRPGHFRLARPIEDRKNPDDRGIGGKDAKADGGEHCEAENEWHKKRSHGLIPGLSWNSIYLAQSTRIDGLRY